MVISVILTCWWTGGWTGGWTEPRCQPRFAFGAVGMRNVLVHGCFAVDLSRLAAAIREESGDMQTFAYDAAGWLVE